MGAYSQLAEKCQKCPDRNVCKNKRMEACAYIEDPCIAAPVAENFAESAAAPVLRETMAICIGGQKTTVYKDEIEKLIYGQLQKPFSLNSAF